MELQKIKNTVGLFFGSFNPIHIGHLIIANQICTCSTLEQVWFVPSPLSPFKKKKDLLSETDRFYMIQSAIENDARLGLTDIEFNLPQPNYTSTTLTYLKERYPHLSFHLIMGSDNLVNFHKWQNAEQIIQQHHLYVYQRPGDPIHNHQLDNYTANIHHIEGPLLNISASFIRKQLKQNRSIKYLVPQTVEKHIDEMGFYRNL